MFNKYANWIFQALQVVLLSYLHSFTKCEMNDLLKNKKLLKRLTSFLLSFNNRIILP